MKRPATLKKLLAEIEVKLEQEGRWDIVLIHDSGLVEHWKDVLQYNRLRVAAVGV